MIADNIMRPASERLGDTGAVHWTRIQLLESVNNAQRAVCKAVPKAFVVTGNITLVSGTSQGLPSGGLRLRSVTRNMGTDGNTPGPSIRLVEKGLLDDFSPGWHSASEVAEIQEYCFDDTNPSKLFVNPPADATSQIEVVYFSEPTDCATDQSEIALPSSYGPALIEWVLFESLTRDSEEANYQHGLASQQLFFNLLGVKDQADKATSPKTREHLQ